MGILVPLVLFDTKHCNPVKYLGHCYLWQLWIQAQAEFASYSGMSGEEIEVFSWWFMVSWFFFIGRSAYIPFAAMCNKDMREAVNGCTRVMRGYTSKRVTMVATIRCVAIFFDVCWSCMFMNYLRNLWIHYATLTSLTKNRRYLSCMIATVFHCWMWLFTVKAPYEEVMVMHVRCVNINGRTVWDLMSSNANHSNNSRIDQDIFRIKMWFLWEGAQREGGDLSMRYFCWY